MKGKSIALGIYFVFVVLDTIFLGNTVLFCEDDEHSKKIILKFKKNIFVPPCIENYL